MCREVTFLSHLFPGFGRYIVLSTDWGFIFCRENISSQRKFSPQAPVHLPLIYCWYPLHFVLISDLSIFIESKIQNKRRPPSHEFGFNTTGACGLYFCYIPSPSWTLFSCDPINKHIFIKLWLYHNVTIPCHWLIWMVLYS